MSQPNIGTLPHYHHLPTHSHDALLTHLTLPAAAYTTVEHCMRATICTIGTRGLTQSLTLLCLRNVSATSICLKSFGDQGAAC